MCVLWFTSLSFPLKCFLQNILCSVFLGYIFFIFGFCLFVLWFTSLSFPLMFFLIFFVLYFKVIFFLIFGFCLCVYFGLPSSPSHLFCSHNTFDFLKIIYFLILLFGHLALRTTCLTHALLLQVLEHCIFSQDRHIVVTAKPLQTSTANTPGILVATTRPCHSG